MKIRRATAHDESKLLALMRESFELETDALADEWDKTEHAIKILLNDSQAGEAYITLDEKGDLSGYIIMCRGFSLDYGGYFTWVEESYIRKSDQGRFRDKRFSP